MPEKAGIQIRDIPGFRVALAIASLPGMTDELCRELLGLHIGFIERLRTALASATLLR